MHPPNPSLPFPYPVLPQINKTQSQPPRPAAALNYRHLPPRPAVNQSRRPELRRRPKLSPSTKLTSACDCRRGEASNPLPPPRPAAATLLFSTRCRHRRPAAATLLRPAGGKSLSPSLLFWLSCADYTG
ncbi:unnamed protein product [Linum trigynum]|uniref:Uncharacterized protein n=1 Tax=Linum trigynum TaxID=586398 RepID=A0AAV2G011_9ROSI